jgi:putative glutamine amidotransferase
METGGGLSLDVVDRAYAIAVVEAGGVPHLLPCPVAPYAHDLLQGIDGLLLTGGGDVDPRAYGATPSPQVGGVDDTRDAWEVELVQRAVQVSMPILGVCRGCQMVNVALGGTLFQHLPEVTELPHLVPRPRDQVAHPVRLQQGSRLARVEGTLDMGVNSIHHQAVDHVGDGLRATAWAPDGVIEGIEHVEEPIIGVQWHPENLLHDTAHLALFAWLTRVILGAGHHD